MSRSSAADRATRYFRLVPLIGSQVYTICNFDPAHFMLKLAHKDVGLAMELGRQFGVPMAAGNLAHQEMTAALNRGWQDRDSRVAMLLQEERAGNIEVRFDKE